jgi:hypothetical protein
VLANDVVTNLCSTNLHATNILRSPQGYLFIGFNSPMRLSNDEYYMLAKVNQTNNAVTGIDTSLQNMAWGTLSPSLHELAGRGFVEQENKRLMLDEITHGVDELGVLLMGDFGGYWYGSLLDIDTARSLAPHNNATSLQVVASVLAGILYAIDNPLLGIVEADDLPHEEILKITDPYMGKLVEAWTDWTPLQDRGRLFSEDVDTSDPWQFKNFQGV